MRKLLAFFYAALIYAAIGTGVWWLMDRASAIAEEFQSTTVTLVSPDESFEDARQMVNSDASKASQERKAPEEEKNPDEDEEQAEEEKPLPPENAEPEPRPEREPPPAERQNIERKEPRAEPPVESAPPASVESELPAPPVPPKFEPLDPVDPIKALDLKCCPSESKVEVSKKRVKKRISKKTHKKRKVRRASAASRASARSRARRGGSRNVNRLLATIKRRIARNKSYPSAAKRRRMQGVVRVSFTITRSGGVRGISVSGPRIFAASARSAVRRAFPVNVGDAGFALPRRMSVTLRYRLR